MKKIRTILDSGNVIRYHCAMIDQKQLNSSHQWEVAVILHFIYPHASKDLMFYALTHDVAESLTGDLPAPIKKKHPEIKTMFDRLESEYLQFLNIPTKFSEEELLAVKYADILSGLYFTTLRVNCGDRAAIPIRDNWLEYFAALPYLNDNVDLVLEQVK